MNFPKETVQALWAPWRVEYFQKSSEDHGDFLLDAAQAGPGEDEKHLVLWRGRHCFVMMNLYPYSAGHLMVVPCRKVAAMELLGPDEVVELWGFAVKAQAVLREVVKAQGFNVGFNIGAIAGAGKADHLHLHVVPRWSGDHNFMTVLGDTRVIPEGLQPLYHKLREAAVPKIDG